MATTRNATLTARSSVAVPSDLAYRLRLASGARDMTIAEYVTALVALHEAMRERATEDGDVRADLKRLRLETVTA